MKKFVTFNNFIFLIAFVMFLLQFAPFVGFGNDLLSSTTNSYSFFRLAFGGQITIVNDYGPSISYNLLPNTGLIIAFVLEIFAMLLTLSKNKFKFGTILATPFYIAAGILLCLTVTLVKQTNIDILSPSTVRSIFPIGVKFAVSIIYIILGGFSIIDTLSTFAKPKPQPIY